MDSRKSELADFDRLADAAARRETARQSHADRTRTSVGDDGPRCRECSYRLMRGAKPWSPSSSVYLVATVREEHLWRELCDQGKVTPPWEIVTCRHCGLRNVFKRLRRPRTD